MSGEMKRMLTSKNFLAAWLIACAALLFGQTYPSLKKPLTCGAFIDLLDSAIKGQIVSFILPIAAVLTWSLITLFQQMEARTSKMPHVQENVRR